MDGRHLLKDVCVAREAIHLLHRQHLTASATSTYNESHSTGNLGEAMTNSYGEQGYEMGSSSSGGNWSYRGVCILPVTQMEEQVVHCEERLAFYLQNTQDAIQSLLQRCQHLREEIAYTTNRNKHLNISSLNHAESPLDGTNYNASLHSPSSPKVDALRWTPYSSIPVAMAWSEVLYQAALVFSFFRFKMLPDMGNALRQLVHPPLGDTMKKILELMVARNEIDRKAACRDDIQKFIFSFLGLVESPSVPIDATQGRRSEVMSSTGTQAIQDPMTSGSAHSELKVGRTSSSNSVCPKSDNSLRQIIAISHAYILPNNGCPELRTPQGGDVSSTEVAPPYDPSLLLQAMEGCSAVFPRISLLILRGGATCLEDEEREISEFVGVKCYLLITPYSRRGSHATTSVSSFSSSMLSSDPAHRIPQIPSRTLKQFLHGLQARLGRQPRDYSGQGEGGVSPSQERGKKTSVITSSPNADHYNVARKCDENHNSVSTDVDAVEEDVMEFEAVLQSLLGAVEEPSVPLIAKGATENSENLVKLQQETVNDSRNSVVQTKTQPHDNADEMDHVGIKRHRKDNKTILGDFAPSEVHASSQGKEPLSFRRSKTSRFEENVALIDGGRLRSALEEEERGETPQEHSSRCISPHAANSRKESAPPMQSTVSPPTIQSSHGGLTSSSRGGCCDGSPTFITKSPNLDAESNKGHALNSPMHSFDPSNHSSYEVHRSHPVTTQGDPVTSHFSEILSSEETALSHISDGGAMWAVRMLGSQVLEYHDGSRSFLSENRIDKLHSYDVENEETEVEAPFRIRQRNLDIFLDKIKLTPSEGSTEVTQEDPSRYLFQVSISMSDNSREMVLDAIKGLGSRVDAGVGFNPQCTHLVVGAGHLERSEKYLCACAAGVLMVSSEYVIHSKEAGHWLCTREVIREYDANPTRAVRASPGQLFNSWRVVLFAEDFTVAQGIRRVLLAGGCTNVIAILRGVSHSTLSVNPQEVGSTISSSRPMNGEVFSSSAEGFTLVQWDEDPTRSDHPRPTPSLTTTLLTAENLLSTVNTGDKNLSGLSLLSTATHLLVDSRVFSVVQRGHFSMPDWIPTSLWSQEHYYSKMYSLDLLHYCLCTRSVEMHGGRVFDDSGSLIPQSLPGYKCRLILPDRQFSSKSNSPLSSSLISQLSP